MDFELIQDRDHVFCLINFFLPSIHQIFIHGLCCAQHLVIFPPVWKWFREHFFAIMYILCLLGRDIIGLAETGSGKTGAFALPILNALLETPQRLFALVLTPTRELAFQISEQFEALGSSIGVQCGKCWEERNLHSFFTGCKWMWQNERKCC